MYTNRKRLRDVSGLTVTVDAVALKGATKTLHVENNNLAVMQSIDHKLGRLHAGHLYRSHSVLKTILMPIEFTVSNWNFRENKASEMYTNRKRLRDVSGLTVTVDAVALKGATKTLHVENNNLAVMQSIDIPEAWGTVKVTARGAGYAILQMSVQYNVDIPRFQTDPPVRAFSLLSHAHFYGRNQSHIEYQTCASWTLLEESPRSGMAVVEVGLPTGYMIQQQKLDAYVLSRRVRTLQRAKYTPSKMLFYFDYLDQESTCVNFTIERWFPVANMSRYLAVRVYDYYAPERYNETIFDALPTYLLNICEVCGSSQCPYCAIYNAARAFSITIPMLLVGVGVALARYYRPMYAFAVFT
ncbi:a-macroglobulin receptor domain-containing protein [Phthorimaea operculella]|nr:a-macroglobulin receptor domain-containing protein [Phthorimaea operculella]